MLLGIGSWVTVTGSQGKHAVLLGGRASSGGAVDHKNKLIMFDKETKTIASHPLQDWLDVYSGAAIFPDDDSIYIFGGVYPTSLRLMKSRGTLKAFQLNMYDVAPISTAYGAVSNC